MGSGAQDTKIRRGPCRCRPVPVAYAAAAAAGRRLAIPRRRSLEATVDAIVESALQAVAAVAVGAGRRLAVPRRRSLAAAVEAVVEKALQAVAELRRSKHHPMSLMEVQEIGTVASEPQGRTP